MALPLLLALSCAQAASHTAPKIIGGSATSTAEWPWMTALVYHDYASSYDGQFCGGSLIHPRWVLTAGHCFLDRHDNVDTSLAVDVVIGRTNLAALDGQRITVSRVVVNPDYTPALDDGDIALLELSEAVDGVEPPGLPGPIYDRFFAADGTTSTVIGWGTTSASQNLYPYILHQVSLPLVSNEACQASYSTRAITNNMICAGNGLGGRDSCQGDSGGPLVIDDGNGGSVQVGVVSFGEGCAQPYTYGVYTRVSRYAQWISDTVCSETEIPATPTIGTNVTGNDATVHYAATAGATGYRLYYAPAPALSPIDQIDVGAHTSLTANLSSGTHLYVAIQPYNGTCLGQLSNIEEITVP
ncbi:S1 family peptidase [Endothiovibrio diazotrophicus]